MASVQALCTLQNKWFRLSNLCIFGVFGFFMPMVGAAFLSPQGMCSPAWQLHGWCSRWASRSGRVTIQLDDWVLVLDDDDDDDDDDDHKCILFSQKKNHQEFERRTKIERSNCKLESGKTDAVQVAFVLDVPSWKKWISRVEASGFGWVCRSVFLLDAYEIRDEHEFGMLLKNHLTNQQPFWIFIHARNGTRCDTPRCRYSTRGLRGEPFGWVPFWGKKMMMGKIQNVMMWWVKTTKMSYWFFFVNWSDSLFVLIWFHVIVLMVQKSWNPVYIVAYPIFYRFFFYIHCELSSKIPESKLVAVSRGWSQPRGLWRWQAKRGGWRHLNGTHFFGG